MSGIESLVQQGMQLGTQKFADGGLTGIRYIENPDGTRGIWTGDAYDYSVPQTVTADQIKKYWRSGDGRDIYDSYEAAYADRYTRDDNGSFRGDPMVEYSMGGPWNSWDSRNYYSQFDDAGNLVALRIKNEDKYAANIPYIKDANGNYVPDWAQMTKTELNTNIEPMDYAPAVFLAALGGAAAATVGAGAAAGGAAAGGAAEGLGGAAFLPEAAGAITGAEGFAPLYGGLGATEVAAGAGAGAGLGTLGGAGEVVMPTVTVTAPAAATPLPAWVAPVAGAGLGSLPDGAPGEGGPSIDETQQYTPEEGPYAPGENPTPYNSPTTPFDWWEWVKTHPRELISGIGTIGSIIDDNTGSDGSGGSGGGSGTGWNGPISNFNAVQTQQAAPEGYRPGFSPEHVYTRTSYEAGNPREPRVVTLEPPPPIDSGVGSLTSQRAYIAPGPGRAAIQIGSPQGPTEKQLLLDPTFSGGRIEIDPDYGFTNQMAMLPGPDVGIGTLNRSGPVGYAAGGMTRGPGDGMSDHIPATIEGQQPAVLSADEFVVPADVVSHLGNGSSSAGARVLYQMMDRIRQARTGNAKQAREINPAKFLP